jgi:hypothetical protein
MGIDLWPERVDSGSKGVDSPEGAVFGRELLLDPASGKRRNAQCFRSCYNNIQLRVCSLGAYYSSINYLGVVDYLYASFTLCTHIYSICVVKLIKCRLRICS